jgi:hypothetical protein
MLKVFTVVMPFTGIAVREIEAETEEQAIEKFLEDSTFPSMQRTTETDVEIEGWEFHEQIVGGNVFYGMQNEVEVSE